MSTRRQNARVDFVSLLSSHVLHSLSCACVVSSLDPTVPSGWTVDGFPPDARSARDNRCRRWMLVIQHPDPHSKINDRLKSNQQKRNTCGRHPRLATFPSCLAPTLNINKRAVIQNANFLRQLIQIKGQNTLCQAPFSTGKNLRRRSVDIR